VEEGQLLTLWVSVPYDLLEEDEDDFDEDDFDEDDDAIDDDAIDDDAFFVD